MADFMKSLIKDFQQNYSILQLKMKEVNQKLDYESKINLISGIKKKIKEELNEKLKKVEKEYRDMGEKMRNEFRAQMDSIKNDHKKISYEIDKVEMKTKQDFLTVNPNREMPIPKDEKERLKNLANKLDNQNKDLSDVNKTQNNIVSLQENTLLNLNDQGNRLAGINTKLVEIEENLSLNEQFVGVMANRELFYRLKLALIVFLLFIADIIVLYIKLM